LQGANAVHERIIETHAAAVLPVFFKLGLAEIRSMVKDFSEAKYASVRETRDKGRERVRWPAYAPRERAILKAKFLGDWQDLGFLENFWNPIYDDEDILQYRKAADVWRLRLAGRTFKSISVELGIDQRKACALVSGKNLHPYLVQLFLSSEVLSRPRAGWSWILECTPKPTNPFPKAIVAPSRIQSYQDVLDFLRQFPPIPLDHPALEFFGLTCDWVEKHKPELFGFLLGFLVGDAGKDYTEYEHRKRHYDKTTMKTHMAISKSNTKVLTYVQLALRAICIDSHGHNSQSVLHWNSPSSNLLTWIIRTCLGLAESQRTSRNPIQMDWIRHCPKEFVIAFFQGLAESDGSVDKHGYYAEISSIPNSTFFMEILSTINIGSRVHPKHNPRQLRINLEPAFRMPLFNPVISSYRFKKLLSHAKRRGIFLQSPFFLT
jgi:hypothetical protein